MTDRLSFEIINGIITNALKQDNYAEFSAQMDVFFNTIKSDEIQALLESMHVSESHIPRRRISSIGELARMAAIRLHSDFSLMYPDLAIDLLNYDPSALFGCTFPEDYETNITETCVTILDGLSSLDHVSRRMSRTNGVRPNVSGNVLLFNSWFNVEKKFPYMEPNMAVFKDKVSEARKVVVPDDPWEFFPFINPSGSELHPIGLTQDICWVFANGIKDPIHITTNADLIDYVKTISGEWCIAIPYTQRTVWIPCSEVDQIKDVVCNPLSLETTKFGTVLKTIYTNVLSQIRQYNFYNSSIGTLLIVPSDDFLFSVSDQLIDDNLPELVRFNKAISMFKGISTSTYVPLNVRIYYQIFECFDIIRMNGSKGINTRRLCVQKIKEAYTEAHLYGTE